MGPDGLNSMVFIELPIENSCVLHNVMVMTPLEAVVTIIITYGYISTLLIKVT